MDNMKLLARAAHNHALTSRRGILERLFTAAFKGLVYPQIWEDPVVDMEALEIGPGCNVVTIASGGCNVMSYLVADPARIFAVDLNHHHVELTRLKLTALGALPDHDSFFRFVGHADEDDNLALYERYLAGQLDAAARRYWEGWRLFKGRRIGYFRKNIYEQGLLGFLITAGHWFARMHGRDLRGLLSAASLEEQREMFERIVSPLFDSRIARLLFRMPVTLYGLGIPPAQYEALAGGGNMAEVLRQRMERLACDFPIQDNYFAWQAFGRSYDRENRRSVPPYLDAANYDSLRGRTDRVEVHQASVTDFLARQPDNSMDRYVLLDAQDWMNETQLRELWTEILRTARLGARVIFRTAGEESPLEPALPAELLRTWKYDPEEGRRFLARDRSAVYGGFHLYVLR